MTNVVIIIIIKKLYCILSRVLLPFKATCLLALILRQQESAVLYIHAFHTGMCGNGLTSLDGRPPCFACPIGTFYVNSTYCQSCPAGQTTRFVGSTRSADCILETILRGMKNDKGAWIHLHGRSL